MRDTSDLKMYFPEDILHIIQSQLAARPDWAEALCAPGLAFGIESGDVMPLPEVINEITGVVTFNDYGGW